MPFPSRKWDELVDHTRQQLVDKWAQALAAVTIRYGEPLPDESSLDTHGRASETTLGPSTFPVSFDTKIHQIGRLDTEEDSFEFLNVS